MSRAWLVLRIVLTIAVLGAVLYRADVGEALAQARRAPAWVFALPSALLFLNSGLHALRLRLLLDPAPPVREVLRLVLLGNFAGLVLPTGGGEAVKGLALARLVGGVEPAFAALLASRLLELLPWGLLLFWAAAGVLPARLPGWVGPTLLAGLAMVAAFGVLLVLLTWPVRALGWIPHWAGRARLIRLASLRVGPGRIAACAALAVPFALTNCFVVFAILRGMGAPVTYPDILGLVPAMDVIISLPVTIAGMGVREGMFVEGLRPWGVAPSVAVAAAATRWSGELFRAGVGGLWWLARGAGERLPLRADPAGDDVASGDR